MTIISAFYKALEEHSVGDELGLRQFASHVESWRGKWVNDATVEKYMRICNAGDWDSYGIYRFKNVRDGVYVITRKDPAPTLQKSAQETDKTQVEQKIPVTAGSASNITQESLF